MGRILPHLIKSQTKHLTLSTRLCLCVCTETKEILAPFTCVKSTLLYLCVYPEKIALSLLSLFLRLCVFFDMDKNIYIHCY